jgi:hypothetical protein
LEADEDDVRLLESKILAMEFSGHGTPTTGSWEGQVHRTSAPTLPDSCQRAGLDFTRLPLRLLRDLKRFFCCSLIRIGPAREFSVLPPTFLAVLRLSAKLQILGVDC